MTPKGHNRVHCARAAVAAAACLGVLAGVSGPVSADPADLSGAWSGGGSVSFSTGAKERASCRAKFSKASTSTYSMSATCATASAKVAQTASLTKTGANSYSGNFHNTEFNVSGTIRIIVNGRSQSVRLTSDSGSANLRLSKL